ncbi:MAG: caspase family protein [Planctomycetes bacterium]|nr:caspase family protein [Planctomycetota bacterium]
MGSHQIAKGVHDIASSKLHVLSVMMLTLVVALLVCAPAQAARYAVLAGVSHYGDSMVGDLSYCDDDVWDMYFLLHDDPIWNPYGLTKPSNITVLVDATDEFGFPLPQFLEDLRDGVAGKQAIYDAIAHYGTLMGPDDTFVFYFSGHGSYDVDQPPEDEEDFFDEFIVPYDYDWDAEDDWETMIRDDELVQWIDALTAGKVVVILDTCHSGGMIKDVGPQKGITIKCLNRDNPLPMEGDGFASDLMRSMKEVSTDPNAKDFDDLPLGTQILVLTACDDTEVSSESADFNNGMFTQYLLEAAYSLFSDLDGDGYISGEELYEYLRPWVQCYYDDFGVGQVRQHPQIFDWILDEVELVTAMSPLPYQEIWSETFDWLSEPLDDNEDPLWTHDGYWAYGRPVGNGGSSGDPDPTSGYTNLYVFGYNLVGDYRSSMSTAEILCSPPIDCRNRGDVHLRFYRWLGVEYDPWDEAVIEVSNDGVLWYEVYRNGYYAVSDTEWMFVDLDISAVADDEETVYVRWLMGPTDTTVTYCGWNIDDVSLWGRNYVNLTVNDGWGDGRYREGDVVTIGATNPANFGMWVGNVTYVDDVYAPVTTIIVNGNYTVTAAPPPSYDLTVTNGFGSGNYVDGTVVQIDFDTIQFAPWQFNRWIGDVANVADVLSPTTTVLMEGNYDITALLNYQLTVQNGTGSGVYADGAVVTITASCAPALFDQWVGQTGTVADVGAYTTTIVVDGSYTVQAAQKNQYTLTVTNGTGSGTYVEGQVANIDSTLAAGLFDHWAGDVSTVADIYNPSTTVTVNGNYNITAVAKNQYTLTVTNGTGSGTYIEGQVVNIDSTLGAGLFDHWAGDVSTVADVYNPSTTVTVNGNYNITAVAISPLDISAAIADGYDWVYQNTTFTMGEGGHRVRLDITIVEWGGNNSVTIDVAKVAGSGAGEIIVGDDPGGDPLIKYIFGSMRTDGMAGTGALTIEVTATGDVSGVDSVQIPFRTLPLGDLDGNGGAEPGDLSVMINKLNGMPSAGIDEKRYDLDLNGGAEPGDMSMLINILNGLLAP